MKFKTQYTINDNTHSTVNETCDYLGDTSTAGNHIDTVSEISDGAYSATSRAYTSRLGEEEVAVETELVDESTNSTEDALISTGYIKDDLSYVSLQQDYTKFTEMWMDRVDDISSVVDITELQNISDLIKDFNDKLNGITETKEQSNTEKAANSTIQKLAQIPLIGKFFEEGAEEALENDKAAKTARTILQEMFDTFKQKQDFLIDSYDDAYKLRTALVEKQESLEGFSTQAKYLVLTLDAGPDKARTIALGGTIESANIKNIAKVKNTLDLIIPLMESQLTIIATSMPGIESSLLEDTDIGMFLNTMGEMNAAFKSLTDLSNMVHNDQNTRVHKMMIDCSESMENAIDLDTMSKIESTNRKFLNTMATSMKKKQDRDQKTYGSLLKIGQGLNEAAIEYKKQSETILLKSSENMQDISQAIDGVVEAEIVQDQDIGTLDIDTPEFKKQGDK